MFELTHFLKGHFSFLFFYSYPLWLSFNDLRVQFTLSPPHFLTYKTVGKWTFKDRKLSSGLYLNWRWILVNSDTTFCLHETLPPPSRSLFASTSTAWENSETVQKSFIAYWSIPSKCLRFMLRQYILFSRGPRLILVLEPHLFGQQRFSPIPESHRPWPWSRQTTLGLRWRPRLPLDRHVCCLCAPSYQLYSDG